MWKSNLIIALRVLGRNKKISLINIVGLSAAFAVAVLCLLFVRHETSFDTWHEKGDRIFMLYFEALVPVPGDLLLPFTKVCLPLVGRDGRSPVSYLDDVVIGRTVDRRVVAWPRRYHRSYCVDAV